MKILPNGVAVTGSSHHSQWCSDHGLIHDQWLAGLIHGLILEHDVKMCVDGGAHIGTLTAAMLTAGANVLAFEPNPDACACLKANCTNLAAASDAAFVIIQAALGRHPGTTGFHVNDNAGASHCGGPGDTVVDYLDMYQDMPIGLVKLDVEGWETEALEGGSEMIRKNRPILIVEHNAAAAQRLGRYPSLFERLDRFGYRSRIIQPQCTFESEQFDLLCVPK